MPNLNSVTNNYQVQDAMEHHLYKTLISRVDHNFNDKNRTYLRFSWDNWSCAQMNRFDNAASGFTLYSKSVQAGLDHVYTTDAEPCF